MADGASDGKVIEKGTRTGVPGGARALRPKETGESPLQPEELALFQEVLGKGAVPAEAFGPRPCPLVLVADDDPIVREYVRQILQGLKFGYLEAGDGVETLRQIVQEKPDLVLLDIKMPGLDGYQVLRALRGYLNFKKTLVLAMSGLSAPADEAAALLTGADDFVAKPLNRQRLTARLAAFGRRIKAR